MQKTVFLFPGQGSQYTGMGKELFENFPVVRELFEQASETTGKDLKQLCFDGPDDILMQTENVQPAITLINVAIFHVLKEKGIVPSATAGHSLGEYSSLYAARVISFIDLMKLVQARGLFMQDAAARNRGGMVMPMGMTIETARKICQDSANELPLDIANINSPKQIIISGPQEALAQFSTTAKEQGTKFIIPLKVSGPWHSRLMKDAEEKLESAITETAFSKPDIPFICNATGAYLSDENEIKKNLVTQLTSTVLWNRSMQKLIGDGYSTFIESGPKTVLKNLMRDISKDVNIYNVDNMDTLQKLPDFAEAAP